MESGMRNCTLFSSVPQNHSFYELCYNVSNAKQKDDVLFTLPNNLSIMSLLAYNKNLGWEIVLFM